MNRCVIDTPLGHMALVADEQGLWSVGRTQDALLPPDTLLLYRSAEQLLAYMEGTCYTFDVPLHMEGTPFRVACWQALCRIPYGETRSYGQLARMIGRPTACRAVGGAIHQNPLMIVVPCHRVIGANGSLTGFGGGLEVKAWLLRHEQEHNQRRTE